jgi:methylated-DNA-protein-cysteine methyltransferase-like protein
MNRSFEDAVIEVVDGIPPGETSTYGEVAEEAGFPGAARAVGNIMRKVPGLPWWRVITTTGRLVPGLEVEHTQRLRAEGIRVGNGRVIMRGHR